MTKRSLWELYDELCQRHSRLPVCRRSESFGMRIVPDTDERMFEFILSTSGIKRDGHEVVQSGWQLENHKNNPVVLYAHANDSDHLPVGRMLDEKVRRIGKHGNALVGSMEFVNKDVPEVGPRAEALRQLYRDGIMRAVSVGWKTLDAEKIEENELEAAGIKFAGMFGGVRFLKMDMLEWSLVPVPADPDALKLRCQQDGNLSDVLVLPRDYAKREVELEDGKYGLMLLDGSVPETAEKIIVDLGSHGNDCNDDSCARSAEGSDEWDNEFEDIAFEGWEDRQPKGTKVQTLIFSKATFKSADECKKWASSHGFKSDKVDEPPSGKSYRLRQFDPSECARPGGTISITSGVKAYVCVPKGGKAEEDVTAMDPKGDIRKAVEFEAYPLVDRSRPWDAPAAVSRMRKKHSSDGSGSKEAMDWEEYEDGFAAVEGPSDSFGSYKMPHHDVIDGEMKTVPRGVFAAAQRIQQGFVKSAKAHIAAHYKQLDEKPPWERSEGKVLESLYTMLREMSEDDPYRTSLQDTIVATAQSVYGDMRLREPWEPQRLPDSPIEASVWASIETDLRGYERDLVDVDEFDAHIDLIIRSVSDHLTPEIAELHSEIQDLNSALDAIAREVGLEDAQLNDILLAIRSLHERAEENAKKNADAATAQRIAGVSEKLNKVLSQPGHGNPAIGSILEKLLRKVEASASRCQADKEKA